MAVLESSSDVCLNLVTLAVALRNAATKRSTPGKNQNLGVTDTMPQLYGLPLIF